MRVVFVLILLLFSLHCFSQYDPNEIGIPVENVEIINFNKIENNQQEELLLQDENVEPIDLVVEENNFVITPIVSEQNFNGATKGVFSVSLSGAAEYKLLFELPIGINGVVPDVGVVYNSQSQNGIAGYGWDIYGTSAITRVGSNKYYDGKYSKVNFSSDDRYVLDGQRLILKSGEYGKDGAEYETANYSNLKITSHGYNVATQSPQYFKVQYPNGNIALYGHSQVGMLGQENTKTNFVYALTYITTPQNIVISFSYINDNGNLLISSIQYGYRSTSPLNTLFLPNKTNQINFVYKNRVRQESGYQNNEHLKLTKILDKVVVRSFAEEFRSYQFSYNSTSTGYETLYKILEKSGDGTMTKEPVMFSYGADVGDNALVNEENFIAQYSSGLNIFNKLSRVNTSIISGNFTGQGKISFLMYDISIDDGRIIDGSNLYLYNPLGTENSHSPNFLRQSFHNNPFDYVVLSKRLNHNNILLANDGWTTIKKTAVDSNNVYYQIRSFIHLPASAVGIYEIGNSQSFAMSGKTDVPRQFLSGDFNGDGISELIRMEHPLNYKGKNNSHTAVEIYDTTTQQVYSTPNIPVGFQYFVQDVDRDGYDDFVVVRQENLRVYKFNQVTKKLELINDEPTLDIQLGKPVSIGDFNGDGKLDFVTPHKKNTTNWVFYINKDGGTFNHFVKDIQARYDENSRIRESSSTYRYSNYEYIFTDFNNDGKTDLVKIFDKYNKNIGNGNETSTAGTEIYVYENKKFDASIQDVLFTTSSHQVLSQGSLGNPLITVANHTSNVYKNELALITGNKLRVFKSKKDNAFINRLRAITEFDMKTDVYYDMYDEKKNALTDMEDTVLPFVKTNQPMSVYPKVDMDVIPGLYMVKKVVYFSDRLSFLDENVKKQLFSYADATLNLNGQGFLGFKGRMNTNVYSVNSNNLKDQIKTARYFDVDKNSLLTKEYVAHSTDWMNFFTEPFNFISKSVYTNSYSVSPRKVVKAYTTKSEIVDGLTGVNSTIYSYFDNYLNLTTQKTILSEDAETYQKQVDHTYTNNPIDGNYFIGRIASRTSKINNVQVSKEVFSYTNNLCTAIEKRGEQQSNVVNENYQYDVFGNVIEKKISAPAMTARINKYSYDNTGRFIEKKTDPDGTETTFVYNKNKGWLLSETNHLGQKQSYVYNTFGRVATSTNYLGNTTLYQTKKIVYANIINTNKRIVNETIFPDGRKSRTTFDKYGNKILEAHTDIDGNWVNTSYQYDLQNRLTKQSKPYRASENIQFSVFTYDKYGRLIKTVLPTGKEINTTYNGLSITVNDGIKSKTETKNVANQTKQIIDNGEEINYIYNSNGTLKNTNYNGAVVGFQYDAWGRKTKMIDSSAGEYSYVYNNFGELIRETSPKGHTNFVYDAFGKLTSENKQEMNVQYVYNADNLLSEVRHRKLLPLYNEQFVYDAHKRIISKKYSGKDGWSFEYNYTYDFLGRINTEEKKVLKNNQLVDVVKTKNIYKNGYLWKIQNTADDKILKTYDSFNSQGQLTQYSLGNGLETNFTYDQHGYQTQNKVTKNTTELFTLNQSWDVQRGNLLSRNNTLFANSITENFQYDSFDRLTNAVTLQGLQTLAQEIINYDNSGRILSNNVGDYQYSNTNPYQVESIENLSDLSYYQDNPLQEVVYNSRKAPLQIKQQNKEFIVLNYNGFDQRMAMYYDNPTLQSNADRKVRYYSPIGDIEVDFDKTTQKVVSTIYIDGTAYTADIVQRKENNVKSFYYLHKDYLGSIIAVTDAIGDIVEKRHFDAWGSVFLVQNGQNENLGKLIFTERGYTGHEHLQTVGLINMNARLYDAKLHRFLAVDNFIQDPTNSQNYNRYAYVLNNPLKFTDPSGEIVWVPIAIGVAVGVYLGGSVANNDFNPFNWDWNSGQTWRGMLTGGIIGGVSGAGWSLGLWGIGSSSVYAKIGGWTIFSAKGVSSLTTVTSLISNFENGMKIWAGKYYTDGNRTFLEQLWQGVSRMTLELPQTWIGYNYSQVRNTIGAVDRVDFLGGATFVTNEGESSRYGISIGNFINIDIAEQIGQNFSHYVFRDPLYMHEYGHYIDSQKFGLSYLFVIGLPSLWSAATSNKKDNGLNEHKYRWYEMRANRNAAKYFGKYYGVDWARFEPPRGNYPIRK